MEKIRIKMYDRLIQHERFVPLWYSLTFLLCKNFSYAMSEISHLRGIIL